MREAYSDKGFIVTPDGKICGINLGYDFCAEHEWGIKGLRSAFGVGKAAELGVDARKATTCPENLCFIDKGKGKEKIIICGRDSSWMDKETREARVKEYNERITKRLIDLAHRPNDDGHFIGSMWAEGAFAFCVKGKDSEFVERLYKAFKENDICFTLTPATFKGNGLTFVIRSMIDKETEENCMNSDLSQKRLREAVAATGIEERLAAANCRYFALSPRWQDETKGEIIWWLNPFDQQNNHWGWVTLQDLEDWIKGTGKIPKTK